MASNAATFDQETPAGRKLASGILKMVEGLREIQAARAHIQATIGDRDAVQDASYDEATPNFGFASTAKAHLAADQISSAYGHLFETRWTAESGGQALIVADAVFQLAARVQPRKA